MHGGAGHSFRGKEEAPFSWKPTLNMKLGQYAGEAPRPFGIIHSCPGMDWRHTGLPAAEYEFWLSQIPAANGQLWHSLTGFDAVITDKRLLRVMKKVTRRAALSDSLMQEAVSAARTLLLWNAGVSELGFTQGLMDCHIPFDIMDIWHMDLDRMKTYKTVILPGDFPTDSAVTDILGNTWKRAEAFMRKRQMPQLRRRLPGFWESGRKHARGMTYRRLRRFGTGG